MNFSWDENKAKVNQQNEKGVYMKKSSKDDMLKEYDFSKGARGKYYQRYHQRSNVVVLEPDMVDAFPNAEAGD